MTATAIKKQFDNYMPLLTTKQQELLLEMAKSLLHIDTNEKQISVEQYNKEIEAAVKRVRGGKSVSNDDVMNEMEKW
ncbi:MAG: hypothetical protein KF900_11890 [Bacteroidetes bacterium]|nr:hypothetical protein [Bacteroidota bacterium]